MQKKTKYTVMSLGENAGEVTIYRLIIIPLKGWNSSNIWEQSKMNQNSIQEKI